MSYNCDKSTAPSCNKLILHSKIIFNITITEQSIYLYFQLLGATGYIMNCIQQNTHSTILRFMCSDTTFGPISLTGTLTSTSVLFPKMIFM